MLDAAELPFDLCTPGDAATCNGVCAGLEARLADDAARVIDRTLVETECEFQCYCVVDVDGLCFRTDWWSTDSYPSWDEVPCP